MTEQRNIAFSPPDVGQAEIEAVADALRSGWITTGPKTKQLERELAGFVGTSKVACLNSCTAALECGLRLLGVGPGDEVITSAYTYTATAAAIVHVGATPVLCDTAPGSYEMHYDLIPSLITPKTRAIMPVDIAGRMVNYERLREVAGELPLLADGAHSLGARQRGLNAGQAADLTAFSFHAVKNFTTAEGGALTWRPGAFDDEDAYQRVMLMSLHGQTKDALAKTKVGAWEYDIAFPGWKCNMTDIQAAIGLTQLERYPQLLARRRAIVERYEEGLASAAITMLRHFEGNPDENGFASSAHLMLVRLDGRDRAFRDALIELLAEAGVATNVHYKPLPMLSAYRDLGFDIADFPNAAAQFENEITLPLHTLLSDSDVDYVIEQFLRCVHELEEAR